MKLVTALGYAADVWILGAYGHAVKTGRQRPFHWANALGCLPLLAVEVAGGLWQVAVLTATFGVLGWLGVWRTASAT